MSAQQRHRDVAAYALGVLEPGDAFRFEEHLAGCVMCAVWLSDFAPAAAALAELAGPCPVWGRRPGGRMLERLTREVAGRARRARRRRLALVAGAAALIVALPAGVVAHRDGAAGRPVADGQTTVVRDEASGVTAEATTRDREWGTEVALRLSGLAGLPGLPGLPDRKEFRLVAVGKDGADHPVLGWSQPSGSGPRGAAGEPVTLEGGTDLPSGQIARWEVRDEGGERVLSLGGDGSP
ncbi:zf-HC2 domain-containing protein [Streptomyces sp. PR69]|uniref:zf-HC2 domain-containing protein n=1 Tax=Streptomyces sp. PR69 TaxID=2984950 RepID=UPI0022655779|nr:zf-HC2 domain-containing protein [Streptomyces sp. PR69]